MSIGDDEWRPHLLRQTQIVTLTARVAALEGALDHLAQDMENHQEGDDMWITLYASARRAREVLTTPAKPFKLRDQFTEKEWAERETWGEK